MIYKPWSVPERVLGGPWGSSVISEIQGGSMVVDPSLAGFWFDSDVTFGNSFGGFKFGLGDPWGSLGGTAREGWGSMADTLSTLAATRARPEPFQILAKSLASYAFPSIDVICKLLGRSWPASGGSSRGHCRRRRRSRGGPRRLLLVLAGPTPIDRQGVRGRQPLTPLEAMLK